MAARLSESGRYRVLLLEAGGRDSYPWIHIPLGYPKTFTNPRVNWMFESEPEPQLNGRTSYQPRGKVLGGTSSINGMVYMRGTPPTTTAGASAAARAGTTTSVLPYFKKAEDQERGADEFHGVGGPLQGVEPACAARSATRWSRPRSRPASRPTPTSTAPARKASATTRRRPATAGAGARRAPI